MGELGGQPRAGCGAPSTPPPKTPGFGTRQTRAPSAATAGISVGGALSHRPPRLLWGKSQGLAGTPPPANHDGKGLFRGGSRLAAAAPFVCSCWRGGVKEAQEGLGVALPPPRRGRDVGQQLQPRRGLAAEFSFPRVAASAVQQSTWRGTFPSVAKRGKKKPKNPRTPILQVLGTRGFRPAPPCRGARCAFLRGGEQRPCRMEPRSWQPLLRPAAAPGPTSPRPNFGCPGTAVALHGVRTGDPARTAPAASQGPRFDRPKLALRDQTTRINI